MTELRSEWKKNATCTALEEPDLVAIAGKDSKLLGARLPDTEALQQMYVKAQLYKQGGDHMSSIIYASMALWSYRAQVKSEKELDEDVQEMFLGIIRTGRTKLMDQFKKQSEDQDDMQDFAPENPEEMIDKVTKRPLTFDELSGMTSEKQQLTDQFLYPNMFKFLFYGDVNNVLLYGPPGTGKTFIAKAVVNQFTNETDARGNKTLDMLMFIAAGNSLRSKWEGGTEKNIAQLFESSEASAEKKKGKIPCKSLIFLDEVESIAKSRVLDPQNTRSVTTLLQQIDGPKPLKHTLVMAATNLPWQLDSAFLRRFTSKIFVDVPDFPDRAELLCSTLLKKLLKHNEALIPFIGVTPDVDDLDKIQDEGMKEFLENFQKYKAMFTDDETTVGTFVPELETVLDYTDDDCKWKDHPTWISYQDSLTKHRAQFKRVIKSQLAFLAKYREDPQELYNKKAGDFSDKRKFSDWYRGSKVLNASSMEELKQETLPLRTYIRIFARQMLNRIPAETKKPDMDTKRLSDFENVCILCHYIAEITGPHPLLKVIYDNVPKDGSPDAIPGKKVSLKSNNIFGYSNSDIDKVAGRMFQELASRIIRSYIDENATCEMKGCRGEIIFDPTGKDISSLKRYVKLNDLKGDDAFEIQGSKRNAYVTIDPQLFARALDGYATTTGNLPVMFDYYCFRGRQSDEDPGCKDVMMKRIEHLRSNPVKSDESESKD